MGHLNARDGIVPTSELTDRLAALVRCALAAEHSSSGGPQQRREGAQAEWVLRRRENASLHHAATHARKVRHMGLVSRPFGSHMRKY